MEIPQRLLTLLLNDYETKFKKGDNLSFRCIWRWIYWGLHILTGLIKIKTTNLWILKTFKILIKFVAKSGAQEVKLEMEDIKITIKTGS